MWTKNQIMQAMDTDTYIHTYIHIFTRHVTSVSRHVTFVVQTTRGGSGVAHLMSESLNIQVRLLRFCPTVLVG